MMGILIILGHTPNRLEPRPSSVDFRLALETVTLTLFNAHRVGERESELGADFSSLFAAKT
jgi:hypothetical protein